MKVFISHQKSDRDAAKKIADYLISVGIQVYFDEFDRELQQADAANDPKGVVAAIKKGINTSTHMLCVISPSTLNSKWVPFEVGYGYDKTDLKTLTLKGIKNSDLPDYIKTQPIIRDIYDINSFVERSVTNGKLILENKSFSNYKSSYHPLSNVMDSYIS